MPPDRVSVGSPGGAGGNEIETARLALSKINDHAKYLAEPAWDLEGCALVGVQIFRLAGEAIAALDAVGRSPQGDPTVPWQQWNDEVNTRIDAQIELHDARAEIKRLLSPQGEDPDGGFDSAAGETHSWPQGKEHEAPPPGKFVSIAANKAMAAPVSGTEPMVEAERMEHWKNRAVDAEMKLTQVSGTEPDTAKLCPCCGHEWKRHDPEDGRCDAHSAEPSVLGPCRCGRDVAFTVAANARLSRKALDAR